MKINLDEVIQIITELKIKHHFKEKEQGEEEFMRIKRNDLYSFSIKVLRMIIEDERKRINDGF